mmetsp:Transcript_2512/g.2805  ORF Transcript_2512/g.2805 Transcript_2512/m.2805 type:complete len:108 (+) Transcript_2512:57-380(+)
MEIQHRNIETASQLQKEILFLSARIEQAQNSDPSNLQELLDTLDWYKLQLKETGQTAAVVNKDPFALTVQTRECRQILANTTCCDIEAYCCCGGSKQPKYALSHPPL